MFFSVVLKHLCILTEYFHGDENEDASNFHKDSQPLLDSNEKLNRFLKKNYRVVSHALNQNMKNIFFDYSVDVNESHKDLSNDVIIKSKKKFSYSTNSVITCLDWSYQVSSYIINQSLRSTGQFFFYLMF